MKKLQELKNILSVKSKSKKGFTLIELIVVIAIIAILAAVALPRMSGYTETAKASNRLTEATTVYNAAAAYDASAIIPKNSSANYTFSTGDLENSMSNSITITGSDDPTGEGQYAVTVYRKNSTTALPSTTFVNTTTAPSLDNGDVYVVTTWNPAANSNAGGLEYYAW